MIGRTSVAERAAHVQEKARELLDEAPSVVARARSLVSGDAHFFSVQPRPEQIRKQLEDESVSTKKDAMKRVIAQICLGQDMSSLFPDVVKNVLIPSIELRKLIYFYIVHYCEVRPNECLLSISAFQKDLVDASMHVRALALRVLASIRLPAIHPVVMIAMKKGVTDPATIVRKTVAIALVKAFVITKGQESVDVIIQLIHQLLGDRSTEVVGAASLAFLEVCPSRFDIIHKHYREICRGLIAADEWSQCMILQMLLRYARNQFGDPNAIEKKPADSKPSTPPKPAKADNSSDDSSSSDDDETPATKNLTDATSELHPDHRLLLTTVKPLFMSISRAVVVAAASVYYHCAPESEIDVCVRPLLRQLSAPPHVQHVALVNMYAFIVKRPQSFAPYIREFFLQPTDTASIREAKLRVMSRIATKENITAVLHDIRSHLRSFEVKTVVEVIRGMGWISFNLADSRVPIMRLVTPLLTHACEEVVTESVVVLRQLVTQCTDKSQTAKIVLRLVQSVLKGEVRNPLAKASVIWLVGDNIRTHPNIAKVAPDFFRVCLKSFATEETPVKRVILAFGLKLWLLLEGEGPSADRFKAMFMHLLELVKYDCSYDVRDQGRMVVATLERGSVGFNAARQAVIGERPPPSANDTLADRARFQLGTLSHCVGSNLMNYEDLPEWPAEAPDPTVRDPPEADDANSDFSSTTDTDTDTTDTASEASDDVKSSESSDPSAADSDSNSSSDGKPSPPKRGGSAKPTTASSPAGAASPPAAAPRVKIVTKVVMAPKAVPAKDRIISELFNSFGAKPTDGGAAAAAAAGKHSDPFQKLFGAQQQPGAAAGDSQQAAAAEPAADAVPSTRLCATEALQLHYVGVAAEGSGIKLRVANVSGHNLIGLRFSRHEGLDGLTEAIGSLEPGQAIEFDAVVAGKHFVVVVEDGEGAELARGDSRSATAAAPEDGDVDPMSSSGSEVGDA